MKLFKNIAFLLLCSVLFNTAQSQTRFFEKAKHFSQLDSSILYAEKILEISHSKRDSSSIIESLLYLGKLYTQKSRYSKAEKVSNDGLGIAIAKKDKVSEALFYEAQGNIKKFQNDESKSLELFLKAYDIFEKFKNWELLLKCDIDIAEFYRRQGRYEDSKVYLKLGKELYRSKKMNSPTDYIMLINRTAALYNETAKNDSSAIFSIEALKLSRKIGDKNLEAVSLNELGFSYKNLKRLDTAIRCYKEAEEIWFSIGEDREALNAMNNLAMLYTHNGYPSEQIKKLYFEIIGIVKSKEIDYPLNNVYYELYSRAISQGDTIQAYKYFHEYHKLVYDGFAKSRNLEMNDIKEKYENEKIMLKMEDVSEKLTRSQQGLEQKERENFIVILLLVVSISSAALVFYLLSRVRKTNKMLSKKNAEKDILIQEIHHRVKNNLQFVSSLINMQINSSLNKDEVYTLNDASRRIRAMSLVHEMLYNHSELKGVLIHQYLSELLETILELVNSDKIQIEFDLKVDEMIFDTSKSIALGMITSELVSNAIKYAFKDTDSPKISISLKYNVSDGNTVFILKDNGIGLIGETDTEKKLGMRLIGIFSRQLKGDFKFENENGLKYTLIFK